MRLGWDAAKDQANRERHGVAIDEVAVLFTSGVEQLEIYDEEHSDDEDRFIAVGPIERGVIVVVYTERGGDVLRILSARMATKNERRSYDEHEETNRG